MPDAATLPRPEEVLAFWFGAELDDPAALAERRRAWFTDGAALDATVRERFGALHEAARAGQLADWPKTPRGALALVIVLDQFPRNIHRGTAAAFASDALALAACEAALERGHDDALHPIEALFLYMPMQHAEDREVQARSCAAYEALAARAPEAARPFVARSAESAVEHREIIERFGRFPHRNVMLGRSPSEAERAYLADGGKTFGQAGEPIEAAGEG